MNKQISKYVNKDIHKRIYEFIIRVLDLIKSLPKNHENIVFSDQLIRCVTSMGANDQEADASESKRDFIAKYSLVKKENKEANYWLKLIYDRNVSLQKRMNNLVKEGKEIMNIISTIIYNTKNPA